LEPVRPRRDPTAPRRGPERPARADDLEPGARPERDGPRSRRAGQPAQDRERRRRAVDATRDRCRQALVRPASSSAQGGSRRAVLRLVATGSTNREVAAELGVGEETVKTMLSRAFVKLGARRRAEAVAVAQARGLL